MFTKVKKALALAALTAAVSLAAFAAENVREFDVGGQPALDLSNISGKITITPGDSDRIVVSYELKDDRIEVVMEQDGDRVYIRTEYPKGEGNFRGGVVFDVKFPSQGELDVNSVSGDIDVTGIDGEHGLQTVSGKVSVSDLSGELKLNSVSGSVIMTGIGEAEIRANSVSGSIKYSGGDLLGGPYKFNTTSGSVKVLHGVDASYRVRGQSISGSMNANVEGVNISKAKYSNIRSLRGEYNGGAVSLDVNAVSGSVRVEIE